MNPGLYAPARGSSLGLYGPPGTILAQRRPPRLVQTATNQVNTAGSITATFGRAPSVGNLLIAHYGQQSNAAPPIFSGGQVGTWVRQNAASATSCLADLWWGVVTDTTPNAVVTAAPGAGGWKTIVVQEWEIKGKYAGANASDTGNPLNISPVSVPEGSVYFYSAYASSGASALPLPDGWTDAGTPAGHCRVAYVVGRGDFAAYTLGGAGNQAACATVFY